MVVSHSEPPSGVRWTTVSAALAVLLVALLLAIGATAATSDDPGDAVRRAALPWRDDDPSDLTDLHREVARAARTETLAFLAVDYRDMDPLMDAVLAGATGDFKERYERRRAELIRRATRGRTIVTGDIAALGVGAVDTDSAEVYVAATTLPLEVAEDAAGDASKQPRYYRLVLDLVRVDDRWLTSSIQFVG